MAKFMICKHCGNLVGMIKDSGVVMVCCNEPMSELVANTTDAAQEKHVPVVTIDGAKVKVDIGSVAHPMTPEHHIAWVYMVSSEGFQRKVLPVDGQPTVEFCACNAKDVEVYAYCNLHGLWKA